MSNFSIILNGERTSLSSPEISKLISSHAPEDRPFAIEINNKIIPSADFKNVLLKENDIVEIITAIGGG